MGIKELISLLFNHWRETLITVLLVILAFILGRGFESKYVQQLALERQQLLQLKQQTELMISRNGNEATKNAFRKLGYSISMSDSTR